MIHAQNVTLRFGGRVLLDEVDVKFTEGNCYGLIGANGAGKSTFMKVLSGELEAQNGNIIVDGGKRISVLKQDHFAYDDFTVLETVIMGHKPMYSIMKERDALYAKEDFTDADGMRAGELEEQFATLDGYNAESNAAILLSNLGIKDDVLNTKMNELSPDDKVKILLAQALFGNPEILLLDEPTNHLDHEAKTWLEDFLLDFKNTVIVISHDRHFLNTVCTHIADLDFKKIKVYTGNYDFWYQSSQLIMQQKKDANKKSESRIKELEDFVRRFSANKSKSKQATSRKKLIEKLKPEELPASSRKSPFIGFKPGRASGDLILNVDNLTYKVNGQTILDNISFTVKKGDKIALVGANGIANTYFLDILSGKISPTSGTVNWGQTITVDYVPSDNADYFKNDLSLIDWLRQYTTNDDITYVRGFLGRMLFSGEESLKNVSVLSGGEKARCMFSKMMLSEANALLFDQPTDHLDLESISQLNEAMIKFQELIIFSSHDHELTQTVANRIFEIQENGTLKDYLCSFEEFLEKKK